MKRRLPSGRRTKYTGRRGVSDVETRQRLLDAARTLFAEYGFYNTSVRDICHAANANLAAVNYHFGDKLALYMAVVRSALEGIQEMNDVTMQAGEGTTLEDKLRHYVSSYLPRIANPEGRAAWIHRLMGYEMTTPTPAAPFIVEQMILPRILYLGGVIAEMLGCRPEDSRVGHCIVSLQAQCLFYAPTPFRAAAFPDWRPQTLAELDAIANHIADFSIAGIRAFRDVA